MTTPNDNTRANLRQAADFIKAGNLAAAQPLIAAALKSDPQNAAAWYLSSFLTKNTQQRLQALRRALELDPTYKPAQNALAKYKSAQHTNVAEDSHPTGKSSSAQSSKNLPLWIGILGVIAVIMVALAVVLARRGNSVASLPTPSKTSSPTLALPSPTTSIPTSTLQPTHTPTFTPSNTMLPTNTATVTSTPTVGPTSPPQPLSEMFKRGYVSASLYSAPEERMGGGQGNFEAKGIGSVQFITPTHENMKKYPFLDIELIPEDPPNEHWEFSFSAPEMLTGVSYYSLRNAYGLPDPVQIDVTGGAFGCVAMGGFFIVQSQAPQFKMSFSLFCDREAKQLLMGEIVFTPFSQFAPTPTIPPEKILFIKDSPAQLSGNVSIAPLGEYFSFQGPATVYNHGGLEIDTDSTSDINWRFGFYASTIVIGKLYENLPNNSNPQYPSMSLSLGKILYTSECGQHIGSFKFDVQGQDIVITFNQKCSKYPSYSLQGTLRFKYTPAPELTPTVKKRFELTSSSGSVYVPLRENAINPITGKTGDSSLIVGHANVRMVNDALVFEVTSNSAPFSKVTLLFFAPDMRVGQTYDILPINSLGNHNQPYFNLKYDDKSCEVISGQFLIELMTEDTIAISFWQSCNGDDNETIRGGVSYKAGTTGQ